MAQGTEPAVIYWRMVPVGYLTVVAGAFAYLSGFAFLSGTHWAEAIGLMVFGLPIAIIVATVLLVPMLLIWIITFQAARSRWPVVRVRATMASVLCAMLGTSGFMGFLGSSDDVAAADMLRLIPFALMPVLASFGLTWHAFSGRRTVE